jgi:hypothetical protein
MTRFIVLATLISMTVMSARQAHAQAAIQEPGAYAFYHPNGDVLRAGPQYNGPSSYGVHSFVNAMASAPIGARPPHGHKQPRIH